MNASLLVAAALDPTLHTYRQAADRLTRRGLLLSPQAADPTPACGETTPLPDGPARAGTVPVEPRPSSPAAGCVPGHPCCSGPRQTVRKGPA